MTCRTMTKKVCKCRRSSVTVNVLWKYKGVVVCPVDLDWNTHTHITSLGCAPINVVTFVQQEHGLSSSTTLWSLRGLTSVPKAQQFNDRFHKGIVQLKVLEKLGTRGPHWAEKYVAFSILRTEIFYTAETLYVDACMWVTEWEYLQV